LQAHRTASQPGYDRLYSGVGRLSKPRGVMPPPTSPPPPPGSGAIPVDQWDIPGNPRDSPRWDSGGTADGCWTVQSGPGPMGRSSITKRRVLYNTSRNACRVTFGVVGAARTCLPRVPCVEVWGGGGEDGRGGHPGEQRSGKKESELTSGRRPGCSAGPLPIAPPPGGGRNPTKWVRDITVDLGWTSPPPPKTCLVKSVWYIPDPQIFNFIAFPRRGVKRWGPFVVGALFRVLILNGEVVGSAPGDAVENGHNEAPDKVRLEIQVVGGVARGKIPAAGKEGWQTNRLLGPSVDLLLLDHLPGSTSDTPPLGSQDPLPPPYPPTAPSPPRPSLAVRPLR